MTTIARMAAVIAAAASPAWGAAGGSTEEAGLLVFAFMGFGALIVVFQAVPGLILFGTMVKELFFVAREKVAGKAKG